MVCAACVKNKGNGESLYSEYKACPATLKILSWYMYYYAWWAAVSFWDFNRALIKILFFHIVLLYM